MNENYDKMDFIIIIVISLLVAFIIGFNIIQVIDNKLSSVTINVPPQNCNLPPIYLNVDKDLNIKQIKLNDVVSTVNNEENMKESFGNIRDYPDNYNSPKNSLIAGIINSDNAEKIIDQQLIYETDINPNYNTLNNIPLLISPDTDNPNKASSTSIGYYKSSRLELIENKDSPLLEIAKENSKKINRIVEKCKKIDEKRIPEINGTFDGYNAYVDLKNDSYANITSIGKGMLTPYTSYPLPS